MDKNEMIYRTYKRNHPGENCLESEEMKIIRDKILINQSEKKVRKNLNRINRNYIDDDVIDEISNSFYAEKVRKRNANTHKQRLKELKKNKNFS